jgi:predicted RNase H-like HicB family nuclease
MVKKFIQMMKKRRMNNMYIAHITALKYDIYSVGKTKAELIENTLIAFEKYLEGFHTTIGEFVEQECNESLENYNNSVWVFLREYLGVHTYDITKGYALGWE